MGQMCGSNAICGKEMGENTEKKPKNMMANSNSHSQTGISHRGLFKYDKDQVTLGKTSPISPLSHSRSLSPSSLIMPSKNNNNNNNNSKSPNHKINKNTDKSISSSSSNSNHSTITPLSTKVIKKTKLIKSRPSGNIYIEIGDEEKDTFEDHPPILPKREQMNSAEFNRLMNDTMLDHLDVSMSTASLFNSSPSILQKTKQQQPRNNSNSNNESLKTPKQMQIGSNNTSNGSGSIEMKTNNNSSTPASVYPSDFADSVRSSSSKTNTFERNPNYEHLKFDKNNLIKDMDDRGNVQIQNIYNEYNVHHNLSMSEVNPLSHLVAPYGVPRHSSSNFISQQQQRDSFASQTDMSVVQSKTTIDWRFNSMSGGSFSANPNSNRSTEGSKECMV